jgi:hypothetical protein
MAVLGALSKQGCIDLLDDSSSEGGIVESIEVDDVMQD